jgi:hypothetical protein
MIDYMQSHYQDTNTSPFDSFLSGLFESSKHGLVAKQKFLKQNLCSLKDYLNNIYSKEEFYHRHISKKCVDKIGGDILGGGNDALSKCYSGLTSEPFHLRFIYLQKLSEIYFEQSEFEDALSHNEAAIDLLLLMEIQIPNIQIEYLDEILVPMHLHRKKLLQQLYEYWQNTGVFEG